MNDNGKLYLTAEGKVLIPDPREEHIEVYRRIWPGFRVNSVRPPSGYSPRIRRTIDSGLIWEKIRQGKEELGTCRLCARQCGRPLYHPGILLP